MNHPSRRTFMLQLAAGGAAVGSSAAMAQAKVDENDPQAKALGFKSDTTQVDAKAFPKHTAEQKCANCALYQGKPTDAQAPCTLFAGKIVPGAGWCSAWAKKP